MIEENIEIINKKPKKIEDYYIWQSSNIGDINCDYVIKPDIWIKLRRYIKIDESNLYKYYKTERGAISALNKTITGLTTSIYKDHTGEQFGSWTVLGLDENQFKESNHIKWRCRCKCGNEHSSKIEHFKHGSDRCRECYIKSIKIDLTGKKIGKWTVIERIGGQYWLCRCGCGYEGQIKTSRLTGRYTSQCHKCANQKNIFGSDKITDSMICHIRRGAYDRNLSFNISKEFLQELYKKQDRKCALTGIPIFFAESHDLYKQGQTTCSLDRIDSSKGYEPDNVQWVHRDINRMKWQFGQNHLITLCRKIVKYSNNYNKIWKQKNIEDLSIYLHSHYKKIIISSGYMNPAPHIGHVSLINESAKLGDVFVLILNGDQSTKRKYGFYIPVEQRKELISQFINVDFVIDFDSDDMSEAIKILSPSIFTKGGDRRLDDGSIKESEIIACESVNCIIKDGIGGYIKVNSNGEILKNVRHSEGEFNKSWENFGLGS